MSGLLWDVPPRYHGPPSPAIVQLTMQVTTCQAEIAQIAIADLDRQLALACALPLPAPPTDQPVATAGWWHGPDITRHGELSPPDRV
jgi:hypothetical protein